MYFAAILVGERAKGEESRISWILDGEIRKSLIQRKSKESSRLAFQSLSQTIHHAKKKGKEKKLSQIIKSEGNKHKLDYWFAVVRKSKGKKHI